VRCVIIDETVQAVKSSESALRKELGLRDLALAQVLCVVGSTWVGVAAKLGRAETAFWVGAMALFYLPLAVVVIYLNRLMPLEGGLYQWAKQGFGEMAGFLTAWNLWVYAIVATASIVFVIPTDLGYMLGPSGAWIPGSKLATLVILSGVMAAIALVAIHGLDIGKWLHNVGSVMILLAYAILLALPFWGLWSGRIAHYEPLPWQTPKLDWFSMAIFGQMTVGALSGFEYVAILAGETRAAARTIGQSVAISAPVICAMFVLGTSSVLAFLGGQPVNVIGPIPQTLRAAAGNSSVANQAVPFAIALLMARAVAAASLLLTGLTRLPMTAGWDHLVPAWFARLHPRHRTPVNSILFVTTAVVAVILLSMLGVREQEASQLMANASIVHYAIAYVALFAIPVFGRATLRGKLPKWLKFFAALGMGASAVSLFIAVYPVVDVVSRVAYAAKISAVVIATNIAGVALYRAGKRSAV
jgi:amino acid transporter